MATENNILMYEIGDYDCVKYMFICDELIINAACNYQLSRFISRDQPSTKKQAEISRTKVTDVWQNYQNLQQSDVQFVRIAERNVERVKQTIHLQVHVLYD
jgi:hypothetical protein